MKAVVLNGTGKRESPGIRECEKPVPGKGQVCVRVHAAAVNRRDFWITKGLYPDIRLPVILGSDGAGIVESVGNGVDESYTGKEVVLYPVYEWGDDPRIPGDKFRILGMPDSGTFAEYICTPVKNIFPKPGHLTMQQTAAIALAGSTAWRALVRKAAVNPGETVLITGIGGGVATLALTWAVALGAKVIVSSSKDEKISRAMESGAIDGFNYTQVDWYRKLQKKYGGVDVIIDGNCGPHFQPCFDSLTPAGRYIIFGFTQGQPSHGFDPAKLFFRQLKIEGTTMATPDEFGDMLKFVTENELIPIIDRAYDLTEAHEAIKYIGTGEQMGKIVLNNLI